LIASSISENEAMPMVIPFMPITISLSSVSFGAVWARNLGVGADHRVLAGGEQAGRAEHDRRSHGEHHPEAELAARHRQADRERAAHPVRPERRLAQLLLRVAPNPG
jgi:hypothetical protein